MNRQEKYIILAKSLIKSSQIHFTIKLNLRLSNVQSESVDYGSLKLTTVCVYFNYELAKERSLKSIFLYFKVFELEKSCKANNPCENEK